MNSSLFTYSLSIQNNEFIFDYRRGIFWEEKKILIVTDLHWGKTTFFQKHGIAISDDILDADLLRLIDLFKTYNPSTVVILGDLIHHERSLQDHLIEKIARFRHTYPFEFILLKGNHDRYATFPESWGIVEEKKMEIEGFSFTHDFIKGERKFQFSGHIHPMISLKSGVDFIRLPAFIVKEKSCLLPAFSAFTGGRTLRLENGDKAIVVYSDGLEVFEKNRDQE